MGEFSSQGLSENGIQARLLGAATHSEESVVIPGVYQPEL